MAQGSRPAEDCGTKEREESAELFSPWPHTVTQRRADFGGTTMESNTRWEYTEVNRRFSRIQNYQAFVPGVSSEQK
jgi:uncharacterized protein (DUF427 family)